MGTVICAEFVSSGTLTWLSCLQSHVISLQDQSWDFSVASHFDTNVAGCIMKLDCHVADTQQRAEAALGAFRVLQDHSADLGKRERLEWLSALTFLHQVLFTDSIRQVCCHAAHALPAICIRPCSMQEVC